MCLNRVMEFCRLSVVMQVKRLSEAAQNVVGLPIVKYIESTSDNNQGAGM